MAIINKLRELRNDTTRAIELFEQRGYWCTAFFGGPWYTQGLLNFFCKKNARGRYVRNAVPHDNAPWSVMSDARRESRG